MKLLQEINSEIDDIDFVDPHAEIAIDKARAHHPSVGSDVEAFVKMMQDEQNKDDVDITALEKQVQDMQLQIDELRSMVEMLAGQQ